MNRNRGSQKDVMAVLDQQDQELEKDLVIKNERIAPRNCYESHKPVLTSVTGTFDLALIRPKQSGKRNGRKEQFKKVTVSTAKGECKKGP